MTQQRLFLVQTLFEALIPIIGYFEWGWDLSFILLFYLLDWLLALGITAAKGAKRYPFSCLADERSQLVKVLLISSVLLVASCAGIAVALAQQNPELDWGKRTWEFLAYEEWGIAQGIVLVPLMVLNGVLVYRQQFLFPARYRTLDMRAITQPFVQQGYVLLTCAGLLLGLTTFVFIPEGVLVGIAIAGISAYRLAFLRRVH